MKTACLGLFLAACLGSSPTPAATATATDGGNLAPNPDFSAGRDLPAGWSVAHGRGRWVDRRVLEIVGSGHEAEYWQSTPIRLEPGRTYRFEARARRLGGSGSLISGPEFANRDYVIPAGDWQRIGHVFRVPDDVLSGIVRLGVWESSGAVQFASVLVVPVLPVYQSTVTARLGSGESILNGKYTFAGTFAGEGSNHQRPLVKATAGFNSDRWTVGGPALLTYRFALPGQTFRDATIAVGLSHHVRGSCVVDVGRDGRSWMTVKTLGHTGTATAKLPASLLPATSLYVRVRTDGPDSYFQVNDVNFEGSLQGYVSDAVGTTAYAEVAGRLPGLALGEATLSVSPSGGRSLGLNVENKLSAAVTLQVDGSIRPASAPSAGAVTIAVPPTLLAQASRRVVSIPFPAALPGRNEVAIRLRAGGRQDVTLSLPYIVADYERDDYGRRIASTPGSTAVWWCDATHKIPRERAVPTATSAAAELSAARNDHEAVQVVLRPAENLRNLSAQPGSLAGPDGASIPASRLHVLREHYHFVHHPTDSTGLRGWWPDALPPLAQPVDVAAGTNQPLWILVDVPADAKTGDYSGALTLKAEGWSADVPIRLHVWNFALPAENHLETAFGFSPHEVFRYHNIRTEADRRKILELYFRCFSEHRISPYDPTPLDPIRVSFHGDAQPPRVDIDFTAFDRAMTHALTTYHFTNFQLPVQGMGGGTFASRDEPRIGRYAENTPEYEAMFSSYLRQLSDHLRAREWLKKCYVYWFDEPEPKDYPFVRAGMARIKKFGPEIPRMLTEEPGPELAGSVDIWCPLTPNYNLDAAEPLRARGDRFWWYVCTGPKAPYCTLFIDHPATELRVWLWQTWKNKVVGNLVWASNWWTSPTAFPDSVQNPYEDPMSYTDGYGLVRGTRAYWGNGDGRFLYPPEAAAMPGGNGGKPVLEPPVSSLRWEMLREGVEDYEFLHLLRDRLAARRATLDAATVKRIEALLDVPPTITRNMTTFTTDPTPIYARRAEVARAIEELGQ